MNESLHIQTRLRTLLQRFYDGTSTPEEEREIGRLLLAPECASDEFAEDRALFEALATVPAQATPPPALGKALEEKAARHFRKAALRPATWIRRGLAAAVAACIATQPGDDLASNAMAGNLICLVSSIVYAIYLVVSNRLLKGVGDMTLLKYTFLGAAVMSLIVNSIYGFEAPIMSMSLFSTPMLVLLFVLIFPTTISYLLLPIGLKYLKTTLVAIYGYLILIVATVTSFLLGQDRFSWTQLGAIVMICISVYLVEVAESKSKV